MLHLNFKPTDNEHRLIVNTYFEARVLEWEEIYAQKDVYAVIHQQRQALVLKMVDELGLSLDEPILEVGCGAGLTTIALARRGYRVEAVDTVDRMLDLTRRHAADAGVTHRVKTVLTDINHLTFPSNHFGLVIAIGVLPWLESLYEPIRETARVTKFGGYLIVNVDNRWRLNEFLDPRLNPIHAPIRKLVRAFRHRKHEPQPQKCSATEFGAVLEKVGYAKIQGMMLGFGPFSFFGRKVFCESVGIKVHNVLQGYADRNFPVLRSTGAQYLVLGRKQS